MRKIIFICFVFVFTGLAAQEKKITWDYPIKPGTEEWKKLQSIEEQFNAYNIPVEILKKISTEELVKICLAYPEWGLMHAYNDRQTGLANLIFLFNGFGELFNRHDAARELIKTYAKMNPNAIDPNWTVLQQGLYCFQFVYMEMLLSHDAIVGKLSEDDAKTLLNEAATKYKSKKNFPEIYSPWSLSPSAGLCLTILEKENIGPAKNDLDIQSFKHNVMTNDIRVLEKIINLSKKKLKELKS